MAETNQYYGEPVQVPASGQTVALKAVPGQDILLAAAFDQAEIRMEGGNVVFAFVNGGQVVLDFTDLDYGQAPNVIMADGSVLNMQEYLASLGESDVEPAAGPDAGGGDGGGVGEYQDDAGNLIAGVDRLGVLDPREFTSIVVESLDADPALEAEGPENDVPIALPDLDSVDPDGFATGNVMTGSDTAGGLGGEGTDIPGNDRPVTVTRVVNSGGEDGEFNESGDLFVGGKFGTLTIKADGSYEYEVNPELLGPLSTPEARPTMTAFKIGESFFDEGGQFSADEASGAVSTGGAGGGYFGVKETAGQNTAASTQINYSDSFSDALAFDFEAPVVSAEIGISNMFQNENRGEAMRWHAFDADGVRIGTGVVSQNEGEGVPYEGTTDITWTGGSNNIGTFTISGIGVFSTLVFEGVPYSNNGFARSDNSDYFVKINNYSVVPDGEIQDVFTYTITDANGDSSEATLTISDLYGKGELVNERPVAEDNDYYLNDGQYGPQLRSSEPDSTISGNVITDDNNGGGAASGRDWDQDTPVLNLKVSRIFVGEDEHTMGEDPLEIVFDHGSFYTNLVIDSDGNFTYGVNAVEDEEQFLSDGSFIYEVNGVGGDRFSYKIVDVHGYESKDPATVNLWFEEAEQPALDQVPQEFV